MMPNNLFPEDSEEFLLAQGFPKNRDYLSMEEELSLRQEMKTYQRGAARNVPDEVVDRIPDENKNNFREACYRLLLHHNMLTSKKLIGVLQSQPIPRRSQTALIALCTAVVDIIGSFNTLSPKDQESAAGLLTQYSYVIASVLRLSLQGDDLYHAAPYAYPKEYGAELFKFWNSYATSSVPKGLPIASNHEMVTHAIKTLNGQDQEWADTLNAKAKLLQYELYA